MQSPLWGIVTFALEHRMKDIPYPKKHVQHILNNLAQVAATVEFSPRNDLLPGNWRLIMFHSILLTPRLVSPSPQVVARESQRGVPDSSPVVKVCWGEHQRLDETKGWNLHGICIDFYLTFDGQSWVTSKTWRCRRAFWTAFEQKIAFKEISRNTFSIIITANCCKLLAHDW